MPVDMKTVIADGLNELLKQKNIDKITVKELVDTCHISRQTFYYHFQDIMDVIEWNQRRVLERAIQDSLSASNLRESVRSMVRDAFQNREMILQLISSARRDEIERLFLKTARTHLENLVRERASEVTVTPADVDSVLCFYSWGMVGMMLTDMERKNPDVELLADQIYKLLTGKTALRLEEDAP